MAESVKLTVEQWYDLDGEAIEYDSWKWGHEARYLVTYEGKPYISQWIQSHYDDGQQLDRGDTVQIWPARKVLKEVWEVDPLQ